ncbi:hypothetical protein GGI21_006089, partial [Coemansia aciculifera]
LLGGSGPNNSHYHHHRGSPGLRILPSPQRLGAQVSPVSSTRTPSSVHTSPSLPSVTGTAAPLNPLRRKLRAGSPALGIVLQIASADSARLAARLGYDWACIDVSEEHFARTGVGSSVMASMVAAVSSASAFCAAVVRIPYGPHWVGNLWAAVEAGAHAVIVPEVHDRKHMHTVVTECRRAAAAVQPSADVLVIPQIDDPEDVYEILEVEGVDVVLITAASAASPAIADHMLRAVQYRTVSVGADCRDAGVARRIIAQGFHMAAIAVDVDLLQAAAADQLRLAQAP